MVRCSGRIIAGSAAESLRALLVVKTKGQTRFARTLAKCTSSIAVDWA